MPVREHIERIGLPTRVRRLDEHASNRSGIIEAELQCAGSFRAWKDLERDLREHAEATETANHELGNIEAGRIFHNLPAKTEEAAHAVHKADTENKISQAAVAKTSRSAESGRNGAPQRGAGVQQHGIKRQILPPL